MSVVVFKHTLSLVATSQTDHFTKESFSTSNSKFIQYSSVIPQQLQGSFSIFYLL